MNESEFHTLADQTLEDIADEIEAKDVEMLIDVDLTNGILTLELDSGQQYILSKHAPSLQIWLSSPKSGGLHYSWNDDEEHWELSKDGSMLSQLLSEELYHYTRTAFDFIGE